MSDTTQAEPGNMQALEWLNFFLAERADWPRAFPGCVSGFERMESCARWLCPDLWRVGRGRHA